MLVLIADRFVCGSGVPVDLATGRRVRLRIESAGTRAEQQTWVETCTRKYAARTLDDFGFIGTDRRFQAVSQDGPCGNSAVSARGVLDWLENPKRSSSGILLVDKLPDARELRLSGFVPLSLSALERLSMTNIGSLLKGHSVVLLESSRSRSLLALALLKMRGVHVRESFAVCQKGRLRQDRVAHVAEGRPLYGIKRTLDARTGGLIAEADRSISIGRHAAAERTLRAAIAAFDRRGDRCRVGEAQMLLGKLILTRGRAAEAARLFEQAHDCFQQLRAPVLAVSAMVRFGVAQTDLGLLRDAEQSCRAAFSAISALSIPELVASTGVALARTLIWLEQHSEAESLLETLTAGDADTRARQWCLVARLHLSRNCIGDAWRAVDRARSAGRECTPAIESLVRRWEAAIQGRVGDVESLERHIRAGLNAARTARLPLHSLKLRLALIDGLVDADKMSRACAAAGHLHGLHTAALPPLLKQHMERTLARANGSRTTPARVREAAAEFRAGHNVDDIDRLRELLTLSHQFEDETEALVRAAGAVRKHTRAVAAGFFGCMNGDTRLYAASGTVNPERARRAFDAGTFIEPALSSHGVEGAVPIRYLGRFVGALAIRWSVEGPQDGQRAMAFCAAAAAACAPLVYMLIERHITPTQTDSGPDLIGTSAAMNDVRKAICRAANAPFTVLIEGESGSGKELVARAIHSSGCRRERRFCAVNCAAMPEDLVDAELFGHAKGAFTGAMAERLGLFESADGGTVFLDEVGELSARAQAKMLRALQEGEVRRVGENFTRSFDARLVAATNRSLSAEVEAGRFRQDLLYRLNVIRIVVPPLRERVEDIPLLASRFWRQSAARIGSRAVLGPAVLSALARYHWPGNVRELQNVLTTLVVAAPPRGVVAASELPSAVARAAGAASYESLETARLKFEERFVRAALARTAGHRGRTAAALGVSRQGLAKLMQRLHLDA
jgi:DNA-binding NtrC family response regulator